MSLMPKEAQEQKLIGSQGWGGGTGVAEDVHDCPGEATMGRWD